MIRPTSGTAGQRVRYMRVCIPSPARRFVTFAAAFCLALGLYGAPLLHLLGHRPDHVHVGDSVVRAPADDHDHGPDADHHHDRTQAPDPADSHDHVGHHDRVVSDEPEAGEGRAAHGEKPDDPDHGTGSFAHFASFLVPAADVLVVVPIWTEIVSLAAPAPRPARRASLSPSRPRGPPHPHLS